VSKTQNVAQNKVSDPGALKAGYVMNYNYNSNNKHQLDNVTETEYRTKNTDPKVDKQKNNKYVYDANGNMIYVNTEEVKADGKVAEKALEKKMLWDEENRLGAVSINGYVSSYTYDAGGERITKMSGGGQGIFVNSVFSGGKTSTSDFSLYVNPYLVAQNGGRYTKHIYIGSQRIVSKLGDFDSYGADPRRVEKAGESFSGVKVDYDTKYKKSLQTVKANYASLDVPYYGLDNNDYVNGLGFCCNPSGDTGTSGSSTGKMTAKNDNAELQQFYYHPDHLGSSSYISNLDGEVVQHIEYVPFGEVFLEEKNAKWNTPYLFTSKELDRETGMYYMSARYQDPKLGIFISVDPLAEKYAGYSSYAYGLNNPVKFTDPTGMSSEDGIDPPSKSKKADTTSRLDGYNRTVSEYNANFNNKIDSFFRENPFPQVADGVHDLLNGVATFVSDGIGLTDALGMKNNTRDAIEGVANTIASAPNMSKEQQGVALGMAAIVVTEIAITEKVPAFGSKGRLGNAATRELNAAIAAELESRGFTITGGGGILPETYLKPLNGGRKGGSYPDISATKNGRDIHVNTVDTYKNGTITKREMNNAKRIRQQVPNDHLILIPKK